MRHLAVDLIQIPGMVAVALGGSRATGQATAASDWDLGLYYRGDIDTDAIRRPGWVGRVFEHGDRCEIQREVGYVAGSRPMCSPANSQ